jgi:hypothetical protein
MGIVSIGEVVGTVQGDPAAAQQAPAEATRTDQESTTPLAVRAEELARELRRRAWRQTRLKAD